MLKNSNNKTKYPSEVITITLIMLNFIGLMVLILLPFKRIPKNEPFPGFVIEQTFWGVYSGEDWRDGQKLNIYNRFYHQHNPVIARL
jgi:hypothetical protein